MKVVFMGTPDFAVPTLENLNNNYDVIAVVTQPDRKRGRGQKFSYSPVKSYAVENKIDVFQPDKVKDKEFILELKKLSPDVIVVVAYGQIIPKEILQIPPLGCVNVHGSLLPEFRGAAPIHWAVIEGKAFTGITTMLMDEGMDTGDMLIKKKVDINSEDNVATLHDKLSKVGADALIETLEQLKNDKITPIPQDSKEATYAPKITKEICEINWNEESTQIFNKIRGLNPWPGAHTHFNNTRIKLYDSAVSSKSFKKECGQVVSADKDGLLVQAKDGAVSLKTVQPQNKKKMDAISFVNGYNIKEGDKFGEKRRG
ncbi:methionyl-tRNA formyltransferase [Proteinivorax hydrogeniformans]|uniref:Methionyl-tRNA formyltransferase n=1 Tax=Proteinivorax hydrogeniformans TaxID=1826727 RepID=A0AAU8HR36_9FIRM